MEPYNIDTGSKQRYRERNKETLNQKAKEYFENLDCLLDDLETGEGYEVTLIVAVNLFVRYHQDDEFNIRYLCFHSDEVVDNVTIDNLSDVMMASYQEINSCMDEERSRTEFGGVQNIRFKLIVDEPV